MVEEAGLVEEVLFAAVVELVVWEALVAVGAAPVVGAAEMAGAVVAAGAFVLVGCEAWAVAQPAVRSVMAMKLSQVRFLFLINIYPLKIGSYETKFYG